MKRPLSYKTIADMIDISRLRSILNGAVFPGRGGASAPPLLYSAREGSEDLIDAANPRLGMMQAACPTSEETDFASRQTTNARLKGQQPHGAEQIGDLQEPVLRLPNIRFVFKLHTVRKRIVQRPVEDVRQRLLSVVVIDWLSPRIRSMFA